MSIVNSYQTAAGGSFGTTLTQSISATGAGNSLLIVAVVGNTPANLTSLSTNLGQTPALDFTGTGSFCRYYRVNAVTTGTTGVTMNVSSADALAFLILEVTGSVAAPDSAAILSNLAGFGTVHTYTASPIGAGDIVLGSLTSGNFITAFTPAMTFAGANLVYNANPFFGVLAAAGAQTLTVTESTGNNPPLDFVSYAAAPSGPTGYYLSDIIEM